MPVVCRSNAVCHGCALRGGSEALGHGQRSAWGLECHMDSVRTFQFHQPWPLSSLATLLAWVVAVEF